VTPNRAEHLVCCYNRISAPAEIMPSVAAGHERGARMPMIETENLAKRFKTRRGVVEAVRGVNLTVAAGEAFGFLGPNGAGKTTTLRMLATLLQPSGGTACIGGHDLLREPAQVRTVIGYVGQAGGVDNEASGHDNLMLQARLCGLGGAVARTRVADVLERLELASFAGRLAKTYSGGQRRRLALALGMVHRPALLFLDEPTVGLDPQSRARLWDELRELRAAGTTIFLTTHYLDEVDALCNRLAIIDDGRIVAEGEPDELKRRVAGDVITVTVAGEDGTGDRAADLLRAQPWVRDVRPEDGALRAYVDHGEQALPAVLRLLDGAGCRVERLSLTRASLDDVFLQQTGRSLRDSDA
jgi:ABC-2 type transport system ATP-binding protein